MDRMTFCALADCYGGDVSRWPADRRAAARAFMTAQPDVAAAVLSEAAALDQVLDLAPTQPASAALIGRVLASAPVASAGDAGVRGLGEWIGVLASGWVLRAGATAAAFSLCLGLVAGGWSSQADPRIVPGVPGDVEASEALLEAALDTSLSEWFDVG